jgi:hypothetical protein
LKPWKPRAEGRFGPREVGDRGDLRPKDLAIHQLLNDIVGEEFPREFQLSLVRPKKKGREGRRGIQSKSGRRNASGDRQDACSSGLNARGRERLRGFVHDPRAALGYREIVDHFEGRCSLEEAVREIVRDTMRFTRRQTR